MDQKTSYDSAVLHLLPQVTGDLTLECVDLRGVVLPVTAMKRFSLRGVSETGSDDRIRRLPNIRAKRCEDVEVLLARWRGELGLPLQARQPGMHGRLLHEGVCGFHQSHYSGKPKARANVLISACRHGSGAGSCNILAAVRRATTCGSRRQGFP